MQPQQPTPQAPPPFSGPAYPPQPNQPPPSHYDFIINPSGPAKSSKINLPIGGNSLVKRLLLSLLGLSALLIIFVVVKGLFVTSSIDLPSLLTVAEQQQELIHITTSATNNASQHGSLTTTDQNFTTTAQLAIGSQQSQLVAYLKTNGHKLTAKQLNLKVSTSIDTELTAALAASTFDQTYDQVVQQQLIIYEKDISQAYALNTGAKGRTLLKADFTGAKLLFEQLSAPGS
jgi:hypothetical protein